MHILAWRQEPSNRIVRCQLQDYSSKNVQYQADDRWPSMRYAPFLYMSCEIQSYASPKLRLIMFFASRTRLTNLSPSASPRKSIFTNTLVKPNAQSGLMSSSLPYPPLNHYSTLHPALRSSVPRPTSRVNYRT